MRFTKPYWAGIADGTITVAFRRWARPTVVAGRPYRTGGGRVEVMSVTVIDEEKVSDVDAIAAGHPSATELLAGLPESEPGRDLYRVEFRILDEPDPRELLANDADLDADAVAAISSRLDRLDKASSFGTWTRDTLALIAEHPATRAPELAEIVGRETQPFKLDVRKLKNLGLTHSLGIGYELSARGRAYLDATK